MNADQIQQQLAAIENSISTVNAALQQASTINDVAQLNNQLVQLKAERTRLQLMLLNLQSAGAPAAAVSAAPRAMAADRGLSETGGNELTAAPAKAVKLSAEQKKTLKESAKFLASSITDRRLVQAALDHSNDVLGHIRNWNSILSGSKTKAAAE